MKVVAFGASNSSKSINKKLATYAAGLVEGADVEVLDLNDYELPLFSSDREAELGQPQLAADFLAKIGEADALIISFAEHNSAYTAAYKNLLDWVSRINPKLFQGKPTVLLATSPGARGGKSVLELASNSAPRFGAELKASVSVPMFFENFDMQTGQISNEEIAAQIKQAVSTLG